MSCGGMDHGVGYEALPQDGTALPAHETDGTALPAHETDGTALPVAGPGSRGPNLNLRAFQDIEVVCKRLQDLGKDLARLIKQARDENMLPPVTRMAANDLLERARGLGLEV